MHDDFLDRYRDAPPELIELARTISGNELKHHLSTQWTIRVVSIGAFLLAGAVIWWAWGVRESLQSGLAIAIIVYFFAGDLFKSLYAIVRDKFRRPPDDD